MENETKTTETETKPNVMVNGTEREETTTKQDVKTYTEDELQKLIQGAGDKVRTEYSKKLKNVEEELNKYKPKTKTPAEIELENRLKILEDKEKEVSKKEKLLDIESKLKEQGLPSELGKYLTTAENIETEITGLKEIFNNSKIDNSYKPSNHTSNKDSITKDQFIKMGYADRLNIFKTNKELYDRLSK